MKRNVSDSEYDEEASDDHRQLAPGSAIDRRSMLKLTGAAAAAATFGTGTAAAAQDANTVVQDTDLGGGPGYENTVPPSAADYTAASYNELENALSAASSGDVVYVTDDIQADTELRESSGVTLASDRGIDGSDGSRLYTDQKPWSMLAVESNARITGLRIDGPQWDWVENQDSSALAVDVLGNGVEIDNVEAYGWGYAAIRTDDDTHVHHNHIHHNPEDGLGYGVSTVNSTNPLIEYNVFDHNRHSVAASGGGGYVLRYNYVGKGAISHVFDQHRPGGTTMEIYNNTVTVVEHDWKDKKAPAVAIRGVPDDVADIHHNWFYNPEPPRDTPNDWTDEAIIQVHTDSWQNVTYSNNHYGSDEPSDPDIGAPMEGGAGRELQLIPTDGIVNYTLVVDGSVTFVEEGDHDAGDADSKTNNPDGTVTIEGATGEGSAAGGDTFLVDGEVLGFQTDETLTIYRNGESIDAAAVPSGRDKFTIIPTGTVVNYTLNVDGTVEPVEEGDHDAGDADTVTEHDDGTTTVEGATGESSTAGGDMWLIDGTITGLTTDADADCYVDGESVSPDSF